MTITIDSFYSLNNTDLNMYQCGSGNCAPDHFFGPAIRDHFLVHYVLSGKGFFQVGSKTYELNEGQGFLICPDVVTYYKADSFEPWHYTWVGFHGLKAKSYLTEANHSFDNPIYTNKKNDMMKTCFEDMILSRNLKKSREIRLLSLLYSFLYLLIDNSDENTKNPTQNQKHDYVKNTVEYIQMNYSREIKISDIANYIGLDKSYLGSIFKSILNTSPQEFLVNFRINKACELMSNNLLSIGDISRSVGYNDPLLFSKMFKKIKGVSPSEYRKFHT